MNVGIVGLGLIGGSMAKSISARTAHRVCGFDIDSTVMEAALRCGAVEVPLTAGAIVSCDLILTALLPGATAAWVREHEALISPGAVLIDLCGIKRALSGELTAAARRQGFTYIGGHPMAGREEGGFINSAEDLFDGAFMILTPGESAGGELPGRLERFFTAIGFAGLTLTTAQEHDEIIAYTSQLAHIASSAYVKSPEALRQHGFSAGSFRDLTRVARLDPEMWSELMMGNADFLAVQVERLIENLTQYLEALRSGDRARLHRLLAEGSEKKALAGGR